MLSRISKIVCPLLLLSSLSTSAATSIDEADSVNSFMKNFMQTYEKRDLNALVQYYEPNAVVIGTGSDEIVQGLKQIRAAFERDFAQHSTANISMTPIAIDIENNSAFATYNLLINVQLPDAKLAQFPLRMSVGLIKHDNAWHVLQSHLSAPLATQEKGQAFPKV